MALFYHLPADQLNFYSEDNNKLNGSNTSTFSVEPFTVSKSDDHLRNEMFQSSDSRRSQFRRQQQQQMKEVRFSKAVKVREVQHRNDMTPSEINSHWGVDEDWLNKNILDIPSPAHPQEKEDEDSPSRKKMKQRQREASIIRKKFLCEWKECNNGLGLGTCTVSSNYAQRSRTQVQEAHERAVWIQGQIDEFTAKCPTSDDSKSRPSGRVGKKTSLEETEEESPHSSCKRRRVR